MNNNSFESDWQQYVFPEQDVNFTSTDEIKEKYTEIDYFNKYIPAGGLPLICDGNKGYINTETEMTMIWGETGSKKSRTLIAPLICNLAKAGESMVIFDIKGEFSTGVLSPYIRGILNDYRYNNIFLDFRNLESDGFNILEYPYRLYRDGKKDEVMQQISHIAKALASFYLGSKADPFWEVSARQYIISVIMMIIKYCGDINKVNFLSVATYNTEEGCNEMTRIANAIKSNDNISTMLKGILVSADKTLRSILVTVSSLLEVFISNAQLLKMMSQSTFEVSDIYKKKTALFIIVPDEVKTYDNICGLILNQISSILVNDAYKHNGELPRRVNFICDEFCNYFVPNMSRNISAHRSRNIRWYLVCQSKRQLENIYEKDADIILANCTNTYFLNSSELLLLEYLSAKAGKTTINETGLHMPLLSVQDLQSLKKGWEYTETYFTSKDISFVSKLPDISVYDYLKIYEEKIYNLPKRRTNQVVGVYTADEMLKDVKSSTINI
jgi:type IV secretion system protein VirD4